LLRNGEDPINVKLTQSSNTVSGSGTIGVVSTDTGFSWLSELSPCPKSFFGTTSTSMLNQQMVPTLTMTGCNFSFPNGQLTVGADGETMTETENGSWYSFKPTWSNFTVMATLLAKGVKNGGGGGGSQSMPVQIIFTNNQDGTAKVSVQPKPGNPYICTAPFTDSGGLFGGSYSGSSTKIQITELPEASISHVITVNVTPNTNCNDSDGEIYAVTGAF
jgi:hypothetical protein